MTVFTPQEQQEIDRANTEGKQPVVFVHGLWLLASSWDKWPALAHRWQARPYRPPGGRQGLV
jgi:pimeloyl-ACP methyl ester carboxylesterase